jgi:hypothetical protein
MDTLARKISHRTLDAITRRFGLREIDDGHGGPFLHLAAPAFGGAPVGDFRLWAGNGKLSKLVYTGITVEPVGLDSHMLFAFTGKDSLAPTFTLDSVYTRLPAGADSNFPDGGDMYAFHLDLVPKCDLGVNAAYMRHCYAALTEPRAVALSADGVFPAQLSPMQHAIMSPWMLAQRTTAAAYETAIFPVAGRYLDHWIDLVDAGCDALAAGIAGEAGAARDAENRRLLFSRNIDPVWEKIDGLLGREVADFMIAVLRNQDVETSASAAPLRAQATGSAAGSA